MFGDILTFIFGIVVLIVLHEFGHFIAARALKVEVEEFGLGFPPRITRLFRAWGTDFTLNAIPLGGFVRPKGENDRTVPGGLASASPWVRITVMAAGPAMNILIGVLLGAIIYYNLGKPVTDKVLIDQVVAGSPAAEAGLQSGDLILEANGQTIDSQQTLKDITGKNAGNTMVLVYQRGDQSYTTSLVPRVNPPEGQGAMGVLLTNPRVPITVSQAFGTGITETYSYIRETLTLPVRMAQGQISSGEGRMVGYLGMFQIYRWLYNPLYFFMVISISLGIFNLLPIPALDGGRIVMTLPEILFHRRVPENFENALNLICFTLLIVLLIYVNLQDVINPISLPK
jgi:regulator of sigma E protease